MRRAITLIPTLLLVACSTPASFNVEQECTTDEECGEFVCEHGVCEAPAAPDVIEPTDADDDRRDTGGSPDVAIDTSTDDDTPSVSDTDTPGTATIGTLCLDDDDCASLMCRWTGGDRTCVTSCEAPCPEGSICALVRGERDETLRACVRLDHRLCEDVDLDGYGDGTMCLGADCDDTDASVFPGGVELCDEVDNDCDGLVDNDITFENACGGCTPLDHEVGAACGTCDSGVWTCADAELVVCEGDLGEVELNACGGCATLELPPDSPCGACGDGVVQCAGTEAVTCVGSRPAPPEVCDGADNDCDGEIDEDNPEGGAACATGQLGGCAAGSMTCVGGSLSCQPITPSTPEVCDGIDNDCDSLTDEEVLGTFYQDADGDGAGNPAVIQRTCVAPPGYVTVAGDCNDGRSDIITGTCSPGTTRQIACGNCGLQLEVCSNFCEWAPSGGCNGQGVCGVGDVSSASCGTCQARPCTSSCDWGTQCTSCTCSGSTICGYSCPDGFHIASVSESLSCGSGGFGNQVRCEPNCGRSFTMCGYSCPSGYSVTSTGSSLSCSNSGFGNTVTCTIL